MSTTASVRSFEPWRPRHVPLTARIALLLGGVGTQTGWMCVGTFGALLLWAVPRTNFAPVLYWFHDPVVAAATITSIKREVIHGRYGSSVRYAHAYVFISGQGDRVEGVSFASRARFEPGDLATVRYPPGHPEWSAIEGMRPSGPAVWGLVLVGGFVAGGLAALGVGTLQGRRALRLLARGRLACGERKSMERGAQCKNVTWWDFVFAFEANGRTYEARCTTDRPDRLSDHVRKALVYDGRNPSRALLLDTLPGRPSITDGIIQGPPAYYALLMALIPAGAIVALVVAWFIGN